MNEPTNLPAIPETTTADKDLIFERAAAILAHTLPRVAPASTAEARERARSAVAVVFEEIGRQLLVDYAAASGQNPRLAAELWKTAPTLAAPEVQIAGRLLSSAQRERQSNTQRRAA